MEMFELSNFEELRSVMPEQLPGESDRICRMIDHLSEKFSVPKSQMILGGFSQGAMLATEVALRLKGTLGGLLIWSGTFMAETRWTEYCESSEPISIVQSHGKLDNVLPFFAAENLHEFLSKQGHDIQFLPFDGFHQTDQAALKASVDLIVKTF